MWYFRARSDLRFLREFKGKAMELHGLRQDLTQFRHLSDRSDPEVRGQRRELVRARSDYAQALPRANEIAERLEIPCQMDLWAPPMLGGSYLGKMSVFQSLLKGSVPFDGGPSPLIVFDMIDQTIGESNRQIRREFWWLVNPFYWCFAAVRIVLSWFLVSLPLAGVKKSTSGLISDTAAKLITPVLVGALAWFRTDVWNWLQRFLK